MERINTDLLEALLKRLFVTEQGIELVNEIRDGKPLEPKPRVRTGRMRGEHVSQLMGFSVRLNDATLQSALLHELDDPLEGCVEYWSWAKDIGGVRYSVSHGTRTQVDVVRPFVFKIDKVSCGFVDVFPTSMLKKSVVDGSALYEEVDEGHWTSPPVVERLSQYGLQYQILTEKHFGRWYLTNIALLSRYHLPDYKVRNPAACETVVAMIKARGYMFRRDLLDQQLICPDDLNHLIISQRVFFPLRSQPLTDMRSSAVFRDATAYECFKAAKAGSDGFFSLHTTDKEPSGSGKPDTEPDFIQFVSPEADDYAQRKLTALSEPISYWWPGSGRTREGTLISPATKALWKSQAERGELMYNSAIFGLLPLWHARGNRAARYPEIERLWDVVYLKHRLKQKWTLRATHGMFTRLAERLHLVPFSYTTAKARDNACDRSVFVQFRDGSAARYAIAGFARPGTINPLYQVTTPLILAHIDHTPLAIRIENSANRRRIKSQVWLTVMIDVATGRKLAWTISFSAPSAAAVMTVLFECIRRNRCLPLFIVVDNAPEFDAIVMHRILKEAESHLLWRPPYQPRYGAPVEAANNKITVQTLQLLAGNTVAVKSLYDFSRTFIARNPELMTLTQLSAYFVGIFDEVELEVGSARTGDEPVKDYIARQEEEVGVAYRKTLELSVSLRRLCMPPASNEGLRKVRDEGYIEVNNLAYFSEDLKRFRGKSVHVRVDLIHPGLVYVYVSKEVGWIDAKCIYADFFALYSKRELLGVIAELRLGKLRGVRNPAHVAKALAEKLLELERDPAHKEVLAKQMDRLMNRAPSLLETEPDSDNYFHPPPDIGVGAMASESSDTTARECAQVPGNVQSASGTAAAVARQGVPKVDGDALNANGKPVDAVTGNNGTVLPDATTKGRNFDINVRPSRLSF
ncbi:transposase family protein [Paraburkholderia sp. A3BS-1L]|uniref:transposase n=1 Tax=Paraburkholderia sp. A3BS-1L TaxID=3028375 RepID=UPI003DA87BF9